MEGYYDIELDLDELKGRSGVEDMLYLKDLQNRKIVLDESIDASSVSYIVKTILQYNADDKDKPVDQRKPILLYISSNGGDVISGMRLVDVIRCSKTPVYTIVIGCAYSMAFMISISGHKRFATRHSSFLWHDGSVGLFDSGGKAEDTIAFIKRLNDSMKNDIVTKTKITSDEYDKHIREEWYMFPETAKELGVIDSIIGEDCDLDEVV